MQHNLIPTTVVGSYPQPEWLIDKESLQNRFPPRIKDHQLWRISKHLLGEAQDDATLLAIRDMERAGISIITDGEIRRESYSTAFATSLNGVDADNPGTARHRSGKPDIVPRIIGPIKRTHPVQLEALKFLRKNTTRNIKVTLPGPYSLSQQAQNEHYKDDKSLALAYANALNEEIRDLFKFGADIVQLDDPYMQGFPDKAKLFAIDAINTALDGIDGTTAVHLCFGYAALIDNKPSGYSFLPELEHSIAKQISIEAAQPNIDLSILKQLPSKTIILGVIDLNDMTIETPEVVAERIRKALKYVEPDRLIAAPDCGMKYLPRNVAYKKLESLAQGADIVRQEIT